jgi:hypothetical protein
MISPHVNPVNLVNTVHPVNLVNTVHPVNLVKTVNTVNLACFISRSLDATSLVTKKAELTQISPLCILIKTKATKYTVKACQRNITTVAVVYWTPISKTI